MFILNEKSLKENFDQVYFESNFGIIDFSTIRIIELEKDIRISYDGFNFIKNGNIRETIISHFKGKQPRSYKHLINGIFFYSIKKSEIPVMSDITQFGIIVNNRVYYIDYTSYPYELMGDRLAFKYIPLDILNSWLYRPSKWHIAEDTVMNACKSSLPSSSLMPLHILIKGFNDKNEKALPQYTEFLETKFNHLFRQSYQDDKFSNDEKYFELRNLLDTRANDDWSESGYQLFVSSHNNERNVYVVPRANIFGIKKLSNPAEAIDHYASHIFARKEGEFDFMQYTEDF